MNNNKQQQQKKLYIYLRLKKKYAEKHIVLKKINCLNDISLFFSSIFLAKKPKFKITLF